MKRCAKGGWLSSNSSPVTSGVGRAITMQGDARIGTETELFLSISPLRAGHAGSDFHYLAFVERGVKSALKRPTVRKFLNAEPQFAAALNHLRHGQYARASNVFSASPARQTADLYCRSSVTRADQNIPHAIAEHRQYCAPYREADASRLTQAPGC